MKYAGVGLVMLAAVFWGITGGIADILMGKAGILLLFPYIEELLGLYVFLYGFFFTLKRIGYVPLLFTYGLFLPELA